MLDVIVAVLIERCCWAWRVSLVEASPHAPWTHIALHHTATAMDELRHGWHHTHTLPLLQSRHTPITVSTCNTGRTYCTIRAEAPRPAAIAPQSRGDASTKRNDERDTKPGPRPAVPFE
jgi:hypothetical protein